MTKKEIKLLEEVMVSELGSEKALALLQDITAKLNEESDDSPKAPPQKYDQLFIISDPDGKLPKDTDFVGWMVKFNEGDAHLDVMDKLLSAYYNHRATGKKAECESIGELIESVPRSAFKTQGIGPVTKESMYVVVTDNKIPVSE